MADCLIIGAGVIGLSLAYDLLRHNVRVGVVDRAQPAREASWAGAGILPPANSATALHPQDKLRALSSELHPRWSAELKAATGIDNGYRKCGGLYLARRAGEAASLHGLKTLLDEERIPFHKLSPSELVEIEPALAHLSEGDLLRAAYYSPDEAQLRNPRHLRALLHYCQSHGVEFHCDLAAEDFQIAKGRVTGIATRHGTMTADSYCVTSGAWTHGLLSKLGISVGIIPVRGQMVMYRAESTPLSRIINEGPRYVVPRDDGRVLVGSTEEEVGFDKSTTAAGISELMTLAEQLVPQLAPSAVERTWAGLRPGSFDGLPYLGRIPGLDNIYVAAGHFRGGLNLSPATAVVMGQLIRGEQPTIDLSPFRVGRG